MAKVQTAKKTAAAPDGAEQSNPGATKKTPKFLHLLLAATVSIFVVEAFVMFLLSVLPRLSPGFEWFLDAFMLTALVFPVLYVSLFRPLRESEERYRALFDLSPAGILLEDANGNILEANKAVCESFGYSREELVGHNVRLLMPPEKEHLVDQHIATIISSGTLTHDVLNVRKDGTLCQMDLHEAAVILPDGKQGVLAIVNDITERKKAEEALQESILRFRTVWEKANDGMRITDEEGTVVLVNDAYCKLVEKPREDIEGKPMSIVFEQAKQSEVLRKHQERLRSRSIPAYLAREIVLWNGRRLSLELSNTLLEIPQQPVLSLSVFRDITERRRAEAEREKLIGDLQHSLENIKTLSGLLPICANCKKIRDDKGYWTQVEGYVMSHTDATFTHGICPECTDELYGEFLKKNRSP